MKVYTPLLALCALSLSACAPGLVLRSPSVEGVITDARTHRPLAQAFVVVTRGQNGSFGGPLPSGLTDAGGHFSLAAQYGVGLVYLGPGDRLSEVGLSVSKDGYLSLITMLPIGHAQIHLTTALELAAAGSSSHSPAPPHHALQRTPASSRR